VAAVATEVILNSDWGSRRGSEAPTGMRYGEVVSKGVGGKMDTSGKCGHGTLLSAPPSIRFRRHQLVVFFANVCLSIGSVEVHISLMRAYSLLHVAGPTPAAAVLPPAETRNHAGDPRTRLMHAVIISSLKTIRCKIVISICR